MKDLTTHPATGGGATRLGFWTAILTVVVVAVFAAVGIATPARSTPMADGSPTMSSIS